MTSEATVPLPSRYGVTQVDVDCAGLFFAFGPDLSDIFELASFDAVAIAAAQARLYGYSPEEQRACESALTAAALMHTDVGARGWEPWGTEERFMARWHAYYLCADAVMNEVVGEATEMLAGELTPAEAAELISMEYEEHLQEPTYRGCRDGLRRGRVNRRMALG